MKVEKLVKKIKGLKDKAVKSRNKMVNTGEWLPLSEFSELEGQVDALTAVLTYYKEVK